MQHSVPEVCSLHDYHGTFQPLKLMRIGELMRSEKSTTRSLALTMVTVTQMRLLSHGEFAIQCGFLTLYRILTAS